MKMTTRNSIINLIIAYGSRLFLGSKVNHLQEIGVCGSKTF